MPSSTRLLVLDDDELIGTMLVRGLKKDGYEVKWVQTAQSVVPAAAEFLPDIVMLDVNLPDGNGLDVLHQLRERGAESDVVMLTADDTASTAMKAIRLGAADYLTKPFDLDEVKAVLRKILETRRLKKEVDYLKRKAPPRKGREMVAVSEPMRLVLEQVEKLAAAGVSTVLITGESGTGKEVLAHHIHSLMHGDEGSSESPFLAVNCAALPGNLIESELFGYEKGAFTDAKTDKKGMFELADGGSIMLDEIGEMPLGLQSKLLRVLEERKVRRIGGKKDIPFEATVIAATNRELDAGAGGEFRSDLLYRLNAFSIHVPPLRERGRDVLELGRFFLDRLAAKYHRNRFLGFTAEAEAAMLAYRWPGNVRELRNVMERLVVLEGPGEGGSQFVGIVHLPRDIVSAADKGPPARQVTTLPGEGASLDEVKRGVIAQALEKARHNRAEAARLLKVSYETLRYQMKKYGLE